MNPRRTFKIYLAESLIENQGETLEESSNKFLKEITEQIPERAPAEL